MPFDGERRFSAGAALGAVVQHELVITDDDTGSWTQLTGAALNLGTTSDNATDPSDVHDVDVVNIPAGGSDVSAVTCEIKGDADAPETLGGVVAGSPTSSSITVSWPAYGAGDAGAVGDSGFQRYRIYYDTSPGVTTADPVWDSGNDPALARSATGTPPPTIQVPPRKACNMRGKRSNSSSNSPTSSSMTSSRVTMPAVPPYSSTTTAMCSRLSRSFSNRAGSGIVSGTIKASRAKERKGTSSSLRAPRKRSWSLRM